MVAGIGGIAGLFGELNFALISGPSTSFGGVFPDVVINEVTRDDMAVTDHPVELGASITDHAFKRPILVEMRVGFSNSTAGIQGYVDSVYQEVLRLQAIREPFDLFTPRRRYRNMLIASIAVSRDAKTNEALDMIVVFRQIIIVSTRQDAGASASAKPGDQAMPQKTDGVSERGSVQLQPAVPGTDGFGLTFSPGSNLDFTGPPPGSGLAPSGADASVGDFVASDGTTFSGGPATGAQTGAPSDLKGNIGRFGSFGPNAFRSSYAPGAFGR